MEFTYFFVAKFVYGLTLVLPLLVLLGSVIALLGLVIGRREGWSRADALYYAFVTATTVGYGDFRPQQRFGKFAAIAIALTGLVMTGIVVAIGVEAAHHAYRETSL